MVAFTAFAEKFRILIPEFISDADLHARWLNTLSYMENCGARKIAACEHPTLVKEEMLKHAAEEFRHAHYLKRQMEKIMTAPFANYQLEYMLGGTASLHYLQELDLRACRYLREIGFSREAIRESAYLFVTYAIELRAEELYTIYDEELRKAGSRVTIKSILLEEKEHLNEMVEAIHKIPEGFKHAQQICNMESLICKRWLDSCLIYKSFLLSYRHRL